MPKLAGIKKIASKIADRSPRIKLAGVPEKPQMAKPARWQRPAAWLLEKLPLERMDSGMREVRKSLEREGHRPPSAVGAKTPEKPFLAPPKRLENKPFLTVYDLENGGLLDKKGELVEGLTLAHLKRGWFVSHRPPLLGRASEAQFKNAGLLTPQGELAPGLTVKKLIAAGIVAKPK